MVLSSVWSNGSLEKSQILILPPFLGCNMKTLFCNGFETSHTKEVFLLTFRFAAPDGKEETVYIVVSPTGTATLHELLGKEIESYVKEYGNIEAENWEKKEPNSSSNKAYLS